MYIEVYHELRDKAKGDQVDVVDDLRFEVELVKQVEVNIDYILQLVQKYHDDNCADREIVADIERCISVSLSLRDKRELIEKFIGTMSAGADAREAWKVFVRNEMAAELDEIVAAENLKPAETQEFMRRAFAEGFVSEDGTAITKVLKPRSRFGGGAGYSGSKARALSAARVANVAKSGKGCKNWQRMQNTRRKPLPVLNPFTPTFGKVPPFAAGRSDILADMSYAFDNGPGDPNLSTVLVGPRGMGKTALLALIADEASSHGWISASVSAVPGMLDDILLRAREAAAEFVEEPSRMRVQEVGIPQVVSLKLSRADEPGGNWRSKMNRLLDELAECGVGLLITVDEVTVALDEMVQLASVYQHFVTEDRRVGLVMAGLPYNVSALLDDRRVSFLRRARQRKLGRVSNGDVENALIATVESAGRTIDADALEYALGEIDGFPFMMQLVGYRSWASCSGDAISLEDVRRGARQAHEELKEGVIEATCNELSPTDLRFCMAMLADRNASRLSDIAERMGVRSNYASSYKKRLLVAGVISEHGGMIRFAIPGFRRYLEERSDVVESDARR